MENRKWHVGADEQTVYDEQGFEIAVIASYKRVHENWEELSAKHWSGKEGVTCMHVSDEEVLETAKLIAGAPKLLEACKYVLGQLEGTHEISDGEGVKCVLLLNNALKKAGYEIQEAKS